MTGFLPVGTVIGFAGMSDQMKLLARDGWLECNGDTHSNEEYPLLAQVLGRTYGGNDDSHFALPNYQGRFLRGVDSAEKTDPDLDQRRSPVNGALYSGVGSTQSDAIAAHHHELGSVMANASAGIEIDGGGTFYVTFPGVTADFASGKETRPINTSIYFLIYAGPPRSASR